MGVVSSPPHSILVAAGDVIIAPIIDSNEYIVSVAKHPSFPRVRSEIFSNEPEARVYWKLGVKLGVKSFRGIAVVPRSEHLFGTACLHYMYIHVCIFLKSKGQ